MIALCALASAVLRKRRSSIWLRHKRLFLVLRICNVLVPLGARPVAERLARVVGELGPQRGRITAEQIAAYCDSLE